MCVCVCVCVCGKHQLLGHLHEILVKQKVEIELFSIFG